VGVNKGAPMWLILRRIKGGKYVNHAKICTLFTKPARLANKRGMLDKYFVEIIGQLQ